MPTRRTIDSSSALSLDEYARKGVEIAYGAFADSIDDTLATLPDDRDRFVIRLRFGLEDGKKATLESVRRQIGISRERVRQLQRIATVNLRANAQAYPLRVIDSANALRNWGGLIGERLEDEGFSAALSKIVGVDKVLIDARLRLMDDFGVVPPDGRAPLDNLDSRIIGALVRNIDPMPLDALESEIASDEETRRALEDWRNFDMSMRLKLILEVDIDENGVCHATEETFAGMTKMDHRLNVLVSVLEEAGKPMHFTDISERARPLLQGRFALSDRNVHARLDRHKSRFAWAGMGMFALTEWGIGVRDDDPMNVLRPTRRKGIGDEIAMALMDRGEPMRLSEIEHHVLEVRGIAVIARSVAASISTDKAGRFVWLGNGWVGLKEWQNRDG